MKKDMYTPPTTLVVELKAEGVICGSPQGFGTQADRNGYGTAIPQTWGDYVEEFNN